MKIKTYSELKDIPTFLGRFEYLKLNGTVCHDTFGYDRYMNQYFYKTPEWKKIRNEIIIRDQGCDLGIDGRYIYGKIIIHHLNPLTKDDIEGYTGYLFDPENLICVTHNTHNAIHYGDSNLLSLDPIERTPNDTCLWRNYISIN